MTGALLMRLLDDNERFDLGGRGTVNHLPMALFALSQLGAPEQRLMAYFDRWEERRALPRRASPRSVGRDGWRQAVGEAGMFDALATMFRQWAAERGAAELIGEVFPQLAGGVAAAAFHGLIRLAYGIEAEHPGEVAAGLAALCARYAGIVPPRDGMPEVASAEAAFVRLGDALGGVRFAGEGIIGRMLAAADDPRFAAAVSRPALPPGRVLEDLARLAIRLYWQTPDFTVLHMVTASHAARVLFESQPHLASPQAVDALWLAACAAYAAAGSPRLEETPPPGTVPAWHDIFTGAVGSNDDHVIKMTYSCYREAGRYGGPLYRAAAARLVAAGKA